MEQVRDRVIAITLGVVLTYGAIAVIGIGAAIAIPADILKPVIQVSSLLAFSLLDLFTIAIPLAAVFLMFAFASKLVVKKPDVTFYALLLAPLVLLHGYFLVQSLPQTLNSMVAMLPRYFLLALCFYLLVHRTKRTSA